MSKLYKLKIVNNDDNYTLEGIVGQSVVDKINKKEFVEFNLRVEVLDDDTAVYQRYHYSPVKNMEVEIEEVK